MNTRAQVLLGVLIALSLPVFALALNSITTGFQVGSTQTTIDAHGVCQKVNSTDGKSYFVPTNTAAEWSAFRSNKPSGVTLAACTVPCSLPWGGTVADGQSVTAYAASTASCGGSCSSQTRTCSGGVLSGSYTYASCAPAVNCAPSVGGYYWYLAGTNQSCDTACASHGGCNLSGTRDYVGSGGTFNQCLTVLSALGKDINVSRIDNYNGWADGCNYYYPNNQASYPGWYATRSTSPATTCSYAYVGGHGTEYRVCACNSAQ